MMAVAHNKLVRTLETVAWLLLIFALRLVDLRAFPVFIDETIHIQTAEQMLAQLSPLLNTVIGRVLAIWWLAFFNPTAAADPIWVARAAMLIASLGGTAALLTLARRYGGVWALRLLALFLLFSPYHLFFERLALADGIAASLVLIAIAAADRLRTRWHLWDALISGGFLALGVLAKVSVLPYAGVMIAAVVGLRGWPLRHLRRGTAWLLTAIGAFALPIMAFEAVVRWRDTAWLGAMVRYVGSRSTTPEPVIGRVLGNVGETAVFVGAYLGWVLVVLLLLTLVALVRRRWYLLLVWAAPLLPLWIGEPQETRYWLVPIGLLALLGAIEIGDWLVRQRRLWRGLVVAGVLLWAGLQTTPFMMALLNDPAQLPLPQTDQRQYIDSDATGFGFAEIAQIVAADDQPVVLGVLANCQGLRFTLWDSHDVRCPFINPDGSEIDNLRAWVDEQAAQGVRFAVLEDSIFLPETLSGTVLTLIERPAGRANLRVIDVSAP